MEMPGSSPINSQLYLQQLQEQLDPERLMTLDELQEAKLLAQSRSHSEAERRRRERINLHLGTLRNLLPNTNKTNKASLLAEVIEHVQSLKRSAAKMEAASGPLPSDADDLQVEVLKSSAGEGVGPRALKLKLVRADMAVHSGRVKHVLLLTSDATSGTTRSIETPGFSLEESVQNAIQSVLDCRHRGGSEQPQGSSESTGKLPRMSPSSSIPSSQSL
eukprot:jgi/Mesen1/5614/ME000282S04765